VVELVADFSGTQRMGSREKREGIGRVAHRCLAVGEVEWGD
jgi:hypothetical protein